MDRGIGRNARLGKGVGQGNNLGRILDDAAAAGTAVDRADAADAEHGHIRTASQGQRPVVLQQHCALGHNLPVQVFPVGN